MRFYTTTTLFSFSFTGFHISSVPTRLLRPHLLLEHPATCQQCIRQCRWYPLRAAASLVGSQRENTEHTEQGTAVQLSASRHQPHNKEIQPVYINYLTAKEDANSTSKQTQGCHHTYLESTAETTAQLQATREEVEKKDFLKVTVRQMKAAGSTGSRKSTGKSELGKNETTPEAEG